MRTGKGRYMRPALGLKVWSTNIEFIKEIQALHEQANVDFVELFCVPDSFEKTGKKWSTANVPFIVHAPHSATGLNFSMNSQKRRNLELACEALHMADLLKAENIIFHPGVDGTVSETIRQMEEIKDQRSLIENKPYKGLNGSRCVGSTPQEISFLMRSLDIGLCLDFGHAISSANSHNIDFYSFIEQFAALGPSMYHLTDGDTASELDRHDQYGKGNFPLKKLLQLIPPGAKVTDEAMRKDTSTLQEYVKDRVYIFGLWDQIYDNA